MKAEHGTCSVPSSGAWTCRGAAVSAYLALTAGLLISGLGVFAANAAENIYRWTDADGLTHFSDQPPSGVPMTRFPVTVPTSPARERLNDTLQSIERSIEAMRDLRAARLGISREELDRHDGRIPRESSTSETSSPAVSESSTARGAELPAANESRYAEPRYVFVPQPVFVGHPPRTSDAFRPPPKRPRPHGSRPHRPSAHPVPAESAKQRPGSCCGRRGQ